LLTHQAELTQVLWSLRHTKGDIIFICIYPQLGNTSDIYYLRVIEKQKLVRSNLNGKHEADRTNQHFFFMQYSS